MYNIWSAWEGNRGPYCCWCCFIQKVFVVHCRVSLLITWMKMYTLYSGTHALWKLHKWAFLQKVCASLPSQTDRLFALSRLKQSGAYLTTTEAVLLQLVQDARHPNFKEVPASISVFKCTESEEIFCPSLRNHDFFFFFYVRTPEEQAARLTGSVKLEN